MKQPVERVIYDNYDLWSRYEEAARENIAINTGRSEPDENAIWKEIYDLDELEWDDAKAILESFFAKGTWIIQGMIETWRGCRKGGKIFHDFNSLFNEATKDCDYVKIWDENGHLYLKCSHHDGTHMFEIKRLNSKGVSYLEHWEQNWDDKRTEREVHDKLMSKYSVLPNFMATVYGCQKIKYAT